MFARGGIPGLKKGFSFKTKGDIDVSDQIRKFGWEGLAWLQRKIMGGSSIPQKGAKFLAEQENIKIDKSISKLNEQKKDIDIVGPKTDRESEIINNQLEELDLGIKILEKQKHDTKDVSGHDWGDAYKWGNEGWFNPLGWAPHTWPFRSAASRVDPGIGGTVKELIGKGSKVATVPMFALPYAYGKGRDWWMGSEAVEKREEKEKLNESGVDEGWADVGDLPQKTITNEVLENQVLKENVFADPFVEHKEIKNVVGDNLTDVTSETDAADSKSTMTAGTSDANLPPEDGGGVNAIDMSEQKKKYESKKSKEGDGLKEGDGEIDVSSQQELNILKDRAAFDASMELDENDLSDIQQYIGFLKNIMGERDPMVGASLLMQLGTSLMNAKTTRGGIEGFLQAAGQAGAEIAPKLMQLGQLNEQKKQSLATAALQMYMDKMKELKPSGAPYMVAELQYGKNAAGEVVPTGVKTMMPYQLNSPQMRDVFAENDKHFALTGFPKYDIIQPGDPRGSLVASAWGAGSDGGGLLSETGQVQRQEAGKYLHNVLDISVPFWTKLIDRPELLGAMGAIVQKGLGAKATVEAVVNLLNQEMPGWETDMSEDFYRLRDHYREINPPVDRDGNHTVEIGGDNISVFIDWNNDYGQNVGGQKVGPGDKRDMRLVHENGIRTYMVDRKDGFDKYFDPGLIGPMDLIQRTIGTGYARSRQPTGRMLADILVGSLKDARFTGFGMDEASDPWAILSRHVHIMNEMYKKVDSSYNLANIFLDERKSNPAYKGVLDDSGQSIFQDGARYLPDYVTSYVDAQGNQKNMWNVKSIKEFANKLYALKQQKPEDMKDIELEFYTYADWLNDTNIQLQNQVIQESNKEGNVITNTIEDYYNNLGDFLK